MGSKPIIHFRPSGELIKITEDVTPIPMRHPVLIKLDQRILELESELRRTRQRYGWTIGVAVGLAINFAVQLGVWLAE